MEQSIRGKGTDECLGSDNNPEEAGYSSVTGLSENETASILMKCLETNMSSVIHIHNYIVQ